MYNLSICFSFGCFAAFVPAVPGGAIVDQQIDLAIVLKLAVNTIVTGREPGMACQLGLHCPFCKAHNSIFSRCVSAKPHIIDRVKAGLAEVLLDGFSVNLILDSADLNMGITIVRERHNIGVCMFSLLGA